MTSRLISAHLESTVLELAHGHAPLSKYPPMKVPLMTIQNAPPGLDYDRDKKFSKSFKEMVAMCLVKDLTKRPTAEKLLKHSFFKNAKPPELSVKKLSAYLPPLWNRVKANLSLKDAAQLALKKMPSAKQEALSQVLSIFYHLTCWACVEIFRKKTVGSSLLHFLAYDRI